MHLVDRLITAIKEQDVLYTIIWIKEWEGEDLGQNINKLRTSTHTTLSSMGLADNIFDRLYRGLYTLLSRCRIAILASSNYHSPNLVTQRSRL